MNMNKATLKNFRTDFNSALTELCEKYDVTIQLKNISFNEDSFSSKIEVANTDAEPQEVKDFKSACHLVGLEPSDLGATFQTSGKTFTISGLNLKRSKYPISATSGGKSFKFTETDVKRLLNKEVRTINHLEKTVTEKADLQKCTALLTLKYPDLSKRPMMEEGTSLILFYIAEGHVATWNSAKQTFCEFAISEVK